MFLRTIFQQLVITSLCVSAAHAAFALGGRDPGPRFGPEFTFANSEPVQPNTSTAINSIVFVNPNVNWAHSYTDHLKNHLIENQPDGAKFSNPQNGVFESPEGWSFNVGTDPGVTEVQMPPLTVDEFQKHIVNIQDAIFVSGYNSNLFPQAYLGGGHINIDLAYFNDKKLLLRNFIVDFLNHNELSLGVFSYDTNSAFLPTLDESKREQTILYLNSLEEDYDIEALVKKLYEIFKQNDNFTKLWENSGGRGKRTAISFTNAYGEGKGNRLEIRAVRPQWSAFVWLRQIRLLRDRIFYLKNFREPIPLKMRVPLKDLTGDLEPYKLTPPVDPQDALRSFYEYVAEANNDWSQHRDYLWPQWIYRQDGQSRSELETFENSRWFLVREARQRQNPMHSCRELIAPATYRRPI